MVKKISLVCVVFCTHVVRNLTFFAIVPVKLHTSVSKTRITNAATNYSFRQNNECLRFESSKTTCTTIHTAYWKLLVAVVVHLMANFFKKALKRCNGKANLWYKKHCHGFAIISHSYRNTSKYVFNTWIRTKQISRL